MIRNIFNKSIGILFFLIIGHSALAQQDVMYSNYMFNGLALNPAYAGSHETLSFTLLHREQWVGFGDLAPRTSTFSVHSPVRSNNSSLGFQFIQDKVAFQNRWTSSFSYAYRPQLKKGHLSIGLQLSVSQYTENQSSARNSVLNSNQQTAGTNFNSGLQPNFGLGLFYNTDVWYVGFSSPYVLSIDYADDANQATVTQVPHYYLTGGYTFELSPSVQLKPNTLIKFVENAPVEADMNVNVLLQEAIWLGGSLRSSFTEEYLFDSFDLLFEYQLNPRFRFGYAYELPINGLNAATSGSHELMLNFRIVEKPTKLVTPRYF